MFLALSIAISGASPLSAIAVDHKLVVQAEPRLERNKRLAREFYENLWFSDNTDAYRDYMADEYVVHDVGERKGVTEAAIEQKNVADLFHGFGDLTGEIDYQIAEGDRVATRWWVSLDTISEMGRAAGIEPVDRVAIINVFRFDEDGKIVEVWNHRHDVELPQPRGTRYEREE
ncbi:ester cyclase [Sphingomicrobium sp. XHP0239]|uniref:ester cyclase n=1 Tax=Sphingomicrobium maritimum TaxID=3133972 RepID=UPI0031CCA0D6